MDKKKKMLADMLESCSSLVKILDSFFIQLIKELSLFSVFCCLCMCAISISFHADFKLESLVFNPRKEIFVESQHVVRI